MELDYIPKLSKDTLVNTYVQLDKKNNNYVELLPGHFKNRWWNRNSIYIEEDVFTEYVMSFIMKRVPTYYLYEECEIPSYVWQQIVQDIEKSEFTTECVDLITWIKTKAKLYTVISVLGM